MRLTPFSRRIKPDQEKAVTGIVERMTYSLSPFLLETLVRKNLSLWADHISKPEREYLLEMVKPYHTVIDQIDTAIVQEALMLNRPDLYAIINRDGGKQWLRKQVIEFKREILFRS